MKNLVIFGDSWSCGAWSRPDGSIIDQGDGYFEKQLSKFFKVENFSYGGASNALAIHSLYSYVSRNAYKNGLPSIEFLIVQTDPIRDAVPLTYNQLDSEFYSILKRNSNNNVKSFAEMKIELFYYQLDVYARKNNIILNIIGGCSDVYPSATQYKNLNVLCYSWFQLLNSDYQPGIFSTTTNLAKIMEINSDDDDNKDIITQIHEKYRIIDRERARLFGYGCDCHPSHAGQDIMINYIINKLY